MFLAFGLLCGILEAKNSGKGQVVDAAMTEGAALLANMLFSFRPLGQWSEKRGDNILDGGSHFYDTYETKDGGYMAIGAIEKVFYVKLLQLMGLNPADFEPQMDKSRWPGWKAQFAEVFKTKTRDEWTALLAHEDACAMPVLSTSEALLHQHNKARQSFVKHQGHDQVAPTPRFSRTQAKLGLPPPEPGEHTAEVMGEFGFSSSDIAALKSQGAVA